MHFFKGGLGRKRVVGYVQTFPIKVLRWAFFMKENLRFGLVYSIYTQSLSIRNSLIRNDQSNSSIIKKQRPIELILLPKGWWFYEIKFKSGYSIVVVKKNIQNKEANVLFEKIFEKFKKRRPWEIWNIRNKNHSKIRKIKIYHHFL